MSNEGKATHPVARAVLAVIALVIIVISGNLLITSLDLGYKTLDLTENKIHSLSEGTGKILENLEAPVVIRYYATRNTRLLPEELKLHIRRVDDLLAEYQSLAGGKLKVENLDPEPDTDAEDAANLDGISGQSVNGENLYFGLAISCLDRTATIPFLDPGSETMLEYEISRSIAEVSATKKPLIGIMSAMEIGGGPPAMPGTRPNQSWAIYDQLSQAYEVENLTMTPGEINPERYAMVLLIHPAGISPEAEFALDQYLLKGGTIMACVDSFSITAQMTGGGNPMMGQAGTPTSSSLPKLMKAWGIEMNETKVVGDPNYQTLMNGRRPGLAILTVPEDGMPQKDSIVTKDLTSVTFLLPGGLTNIGGGGVNVESLARTTTDAGLVDSLPASRLDPSLITSFRPDKKYYDLALHLHGNFKTAFPDGDPSAAAAETEEAANDDAGSEESSDSDEGDDEEKEPESLKVATKSGNVFLISDVDAFYDDFAYSVGQLGNMRFVQPINGNSSLFFNLIDQSASSPYLIGARSRAATSRPFTKFREMETASELRVGEEVQKFRDAEQEANQRLNELQAQKNQSDQLYLSPEQEAEIKRLREQSVEASKQIRELEKDLRREKDNLAGRVMALNIFTVPMIVVVLGMTLFGLRRARTRAH